jgi:RNA polymerase sigma-70 factor, ECF subfamily
VGEDRFEKRSSLKTWLISILRYKILDAIRARRLMRAGCAPAVAHDDQDGDLEIFDDLFDEAGCWSEQKDVWSDPQTAAEQTAFFKVLEACLTRLPERTSRAFLMREWLESEPDEICSALGVTHGSFRPR